MVLPARPAQQPGGLRLWWKAWEVCDSWISWKVSLTPVLPAPHAGQILPQEHPSSCSIPAAKENGFVPGYLCLRARERAGLLLSPPVAVRPAAGLGAEHAWPGTGCGSFGAAGQGRGRSSRSRSGLSHAVRPA